MLLDLQEFMHLAEDFIKNYLHCIQGTHFNPGNPLMHITVWVKRGDFIKVPLKRPLLLMQTNLKKMMFLASYNMLLHTPLSEAKRQLVQLLWTPLLPYIAQNSTGRLSQYSRKEFGAGLFSKPQHNTTQMKPLKPLCWKRSIQISAYQSA